MAALSDGEREEITKRWVELEDDCMRKAASGNCGGQNNQNRAICFTGMKAYRAWRPFHEIPDDRVSPKTAAQLRRAPGAKGG